MVFAERHADIGGGFHWLLVAGLATGTLWPSNDHLLPLWGPEAAEKFVPAAREIRPQAWLHDRFHVRNRPYLFWVAGGPVESQRPSPSHVPRE